MQMPPVIREWLILMPQLDNHIVLYTYKPKHKSYFCLSVKLSDGESITKLI